MKCSKCGYPIKPGANFCIQCGAKVEKRVNEAMPEKPVEHKPVQEPEKKKYTWLWIIGWILIFPIPLTILLLRKKKMNNVAKYSFISVAWLFYLVFMIAGNSPEDSQEMADANLAAETEVVQMVEDNSSLEDEILEAAETISVVDGNIDDEDVIESQIKEAVSEIEGQIGVINAPDESVAEAPIVETPIVEESTVEEPVVTEPVEEKQEYEESASTENVDSGVVAVVVTQEATTDNDTSVAKEETNIESEIAQEVVPEVLPEVTEERAEEQESSAPASVENTESSVVVNTDTGTASESNNSDDTNKSSGSSGNGNGNDPIPEGPMFIGNINNKKLHKVSCWGKLPKEENRQYFSTLEEAVAAGYKSDNQCKNCYPFN